jgi:hypothetical protein
VPSLSSKSLSAANELSRGPRLLYVLKVSMVVDHKIATSERSATVSLRSTPCRDRKNARIISVIFSAFNRVTVTQKTEKRRAGHGRGWRAGGDRLAWDSLHGGAQIAVERRGHAPRGLPIPCCAAHPVVVAIFAGRYGAGHEGWRLGCHGGEPNGGVVARRCG